MSLSKTRLNTKVSFSQEMLAKVGRNVQHTRSMSGKIAPIDPADIYVDNPYKNKKKQSKTLKGWFNISDGLEFLKDIRDKLATK